MLPFLFLYVAALTTFAVFVLGWGPLHHDMTEAWAWGKEFQLGYAKHPPLSAWVAGLWFAVMPRSNWSFYLLASLNIAVALAGVWMLAGIFFGTLGRLASVLFLVLTPSFSIWALKFNVNAPLISTWPWMTYFFLRSMETRRVRFSVCTGLLGGLALLTKYYSLILFGTLFMVALLRPDRRQYFTSGAPYTTIAVGILVLEPHIWWTVASDFPSIDYAISKTHYALAEARASAIRSVAGGLASLGIAAGAYGIAFGAQSWALLRRAVAGTFEGRNAWLIWLSHGPLLLTVAAYLFVNARITGSFLIPAFFATPIVFLVVAQADVTVVVLRRLVFCVAAIWLPMLVASPFLGYYTFTRADGAIDPSREIAIEATSLWRSTFGRPLRYVAGEEPLATAVTFYSPDAPSYMILDHLDYSPWVTVEQAKRQGLMIICPASAEVCIEGGTTFAGSEGIRHTRELAAHSLGLTSRLKRFVFIMRPPEH